MPPLVSLGSWCEPAWQMDRAFPGRAHHFFDWLVTPYAALVRLLETDFAAVFERANLSIEQDGHTVRDAATDILFHHAFSRDADDRIRPETLDAEYPAARAKALHLLGRFRALAESGAPAVLVRLDWGAAPEIAAVRDLLRRRWPNHGFTLAWVQREIPDPGVELPCVIRCQAAAAPPGPNDWAGLPEEWDRVFARIAAG